MASPYYFNDREAEDIIQRHSVRKFHRAHMPTLLIWSFGMGTAFGCILALFFYVAGELFKTQ